MSFAMQNDNKLYAIIVGMFLLLGYLNGCAVVRAPAQEMSDARQAIQAAREADAERLAPVPFSQAEHYLNKATEALQQENYDQARQAAIVAKEQAMRARDKAAGINGNL